MSGSLFDSLPLQPRVLPGSGNAKNAAETADSRRPSWCTRTGVAAPLYDSSAWCSWRPSQPAWIGTETSDGPKRFSDFPDGAPRPSSKWDFNSVLGCSYAGFSYWRPAWKRLMRSTRYILHHSSMQISKLNMVLSQWMNHQQERRTRFADLRER